jgi:transcriptional regulator with XRE-family HTH domain
MNFGEKLVEVRKTKGLTQDEVAEMCKITTRTIQRIESGAVIPRTFTIKTISEALGFDFFETSNTGCEVNKASYYSKLKWYIKDLFNLKTNAMRKLSILTASFLMIGFAVFALIPETSSNVPSQQQRPDFINTENLVEVAFTNAFTLDSLVRVKNELAKREIILNYKELKFDERGHLILIDVEVDCNDGFRGSFSASGLNSENKNVRIGFYRNFSGTARSPFGTGLLSVETDWERQF